MLRMDGAFAFLFRMCALAAMTVCLGFGGWLVVRMILQPKRRVRPDGRLG